MATTYTVNNSASIAEENACAALEAKVMAKKGFADIETAKNAICLLAQSGGTNQAQGNLSVSVTDTSGTSPTVITLTLKDVKDVIKGDNLKITLRQYARTRSQECHDIGLLADVPGDLYKKLQHMFGPISKDDSYWCSSFQMECPNCPSSIRELLIRHYNSLFRK